MNDATIIVAHESRESRDTNQEVLLVLGHPDDVLSHPELTKQQKREILASWASDAHAVEGIPALRQVESGALVQLDEVLSALKSLDQQGARAADGGRPHVVWRSPYGRRGGILGRLQVLTRRTSADNDDDDPPPCPAAAAIPVEVLPAAA